MRVWLLQSRRGGRTCGHLHVRESGAWRCRDTQATPWAWSVVSTFLSDAEGARPRPDWDSVIACTGMVVLALGGVVVGAAGSVWLACGLGLAVLARRVEGVADDGGLGAHLGFGGDVAPRLVGLGSPEYAPCLEPCPGVDLSSWAVLGRFFRGRRPSKIENPA